MTPRLNRYLLVILFAFLAEPVAYGDIVLDFEGEDLSNGSAIPQSYGDNAFFDVTYRELDAFGNATLVYDSLNHWGGGYGDLENVVWGSDFDANRVAEIRFDSLTSNAITLNRFDAAGWDASASSQTFRVYDGSYNLLFEQANFNVTDITHDTITPNASASTVILQWDYPYAVALDNISITAVPEPSCLALFATCSSISLFWRHRLNKRCGRSQNGMPALA